MQQHFYRQLKRVFLSPFLILLLCGCLSRDDSLTSTALSNELMGACLTTQKQLQDFESPGVDLHVTISQALRKAFEDQRWKRIRTTRNDSTIRGELFHGQTFEADVFIISCNDLSGILLINGRSHDGSIRGFVKSDWELQGTRVVIGQPSFQNLLSE